ncbi:MAG: shikimate kinase [bacterium]|nr:shikimate kinase [bacterium]
MDIHSTDKNIVLIGMPGVGKSTVGVLLAKALSRSFMDTDVSIQALECRRLQDIIDAEGTDRFLTIEERNLLMLDCVRHVIATGGSAVYSEPAMDHLKNTGVVVYLKLPFDHLERRIANLDSRGVVMGPGQGLATLYEERTPLYERYADVAVECTGLTHDESVAAVVSALETYEE